MSRVLLAWELGQNLGHLSRLVPIARSLKARGHSVLAMVRDIAAASSTLGSSDISFIQSPCDAGLRPVNKHVTGYADILLSQGWGDPQALWGMLQAWMTAIRMFGPDVMVLDFSPTASLAAIISKIPRVLIGAGFELPPVQNPLPPLPGYGWATPTKAREAEELVLRAVNGMLTAMGASPLPALCVLVDAEHRFLATFPELDHYGVQSGGRYIGRLAESTQWGSVQWPEGRGRIFVYLRPGVPDLTAILQGIAATDAGVIAYLPGVSGQTIAPRSSPRFLILQQPVSLDAVFESADLCVSYAAAGTLTEGLLHGVPQLMIPIHTESQLLAHRVEMLGAGRLLKASSVEHVTACVNHLLNSVDTRLRAQQFALRYKNVTATAAANMVIAAIELAAHRELPNITPATPPVRAAVMPASSLLQ